MKKIYQTLMTSVILLCLFSASLNAQTLSDIGTGTTYNDQYTYPAPFGNYYWFSKHQYFVTAAELTAAGVLPGAKFLSVRFNVYAGNGCNNMTQWATAIYTTTATDPIASGHVTTGQILNSGTPLSTYVPTTGWNTSTFASPTTPYFWNGTDNIIVETCHAGQTIYTYNASTYWNTNLTGSTTKSYWLYYDNVTMCQTTGYTNSSTTTRPNIRIEWIPSTPCNGAPSANAVSGPTYAICPNSPAQLSLANTYTLGGLSFQWYSSTTSSVGPWTAVGGTTQSQGVSVPNQTATSYFMSVATCSSGGTTSLTAFQVTVSPVVTNTPPYLEDFENIPFSNTLPNCSWSSSSSLGFNTACQTYTSTNTQNRVPHSGSRFASFYNSPTGSNYFYTNGIYLTAGVTYSAAVWYTTEYMGYNNWSDLSILYGPSQSPTGMTSIVSTNGPAVSNTYKLLSNTFMVPTTGLYYVAVKATTGSGSAQYLSWDDLSITIPCTPASNNSPTLTLAPNATTICAGETANVDVSGADTYTWNTGDVGGSIAKELYYNTSYQVVGTNALTGCTATLNQAITVNPSPSVLVFPSKQVICAGESVYLTAMGASSYTWSGSASGNNVISVSPLTTTTYSVWGANSFACSKMAIQSITVNPLPTILPSTSAPDKMCVGEKQTLSATGAAAFTWVSNTSNIVQSGANIIINPTSTSVYTVTGTDINGCSNIATITQNVDACTGISEQSASGSVLNVYPNPGSGEYTLEIQSGLNSAQMEVIDLTGKVILKAVVTDTKTSVNITQFANGIYFLKLKSQDSVSTVKIIKQ